MNTNKYLKWFFLFFGGFLIGKYFLFHKKIDLIFSMLAFIALLLVFALPEVNKIWLKRRK